MSKVTDMSISYFQRRFGHGLCKKIYLLDSVSYIDFKTLFEALQDAKEQGLIDPEVELGTSYEDSPDITVYGWAPATAEETEVFEKREAEQKRAAEESQRMQYEFLKSLFEKKP